MYSTRKSLFLSITIFLFLHSAQADLPIHCLKSQVAGEWLLQITRPQIFENYHDASCGHFAPDDAAVSYLAFRNEFQPHQEFKLSLDTENKVFGDGAETGHWTMIYDEGFDIKYNKQTFMSFFEYSTQENGNVMSYCGKTIVGWYHDLDSGEKACFRAEKILKDESEKTALYGRPLKQVHIVQPGSEFEEFKRNNLLQISTRASNRKFSRFYRESLGHVDHQAKVAEINKIEGKLWRAEVPTSFEGMSLLQLNSMAGRKKQGIVSSRPSLKSEFVQVSDVSDLPKSFSWKHVLKPARSQQSCGSCYVLSTIQMIEARLKIKYDKDVELSAQHVLDCSFTNQGCDGGYPYLVGKLAIDFDLVPESCSPYKARKGKCSTCDVSKLDETYRVSSYKFVGGAYGKTNERDMMVELMNNGPITVSFEPIQSFMYYSGGIYHDLEPSWIEKNQKQPEWQRVDHSVLLYGWGETQDGIKYWNILNSWGPSWGENGSFRIKRGNDELAIESMAEAVDPIIIRKNSSGVVA